jgi:hypothetical protein
VVVCDKAAQEPLKAWLPLMEGIAGAGESLLVVTETIDSELLHTFIVNALKATLPACVVHPVRDRYGSPAPGVQSLARSCATPPQQHDQLPRLAEVWIRRTATALFPSADEAALAAAALQNFAVIETGGENHEDQYDRLRFLMRGITAVRRQINGLAESPNSLSRNNAVRIRRFAAPSRSPPSGSLRLAVSLRSARRLTPIVAGKERGRESRWQAAPKDVPIRSRPNLDSLCENLRNLRIPSDSIGLSGPDCLRLG